MSNKCQTDKLAASVSGNSHDVFIGIGQVKADIWGQ